MFSSVKGSYGGPQGSQQNKNHGTNLKNKMHLKIYEVVSLKDDVIIKFHANYCKLTQSVQRKKLLQIEKLLQTEKML